MFLLRCLTESITLQRLLFRPQCRCKARLAELCWHDTIEEWYSCWYNLLCFENNMTKKSNLMILDNPGVDYSRMLLFVLGFLVYWKIEPNSHEFSRIRQHVVYDLISKRSHLNCQKNKMWRDRQQFVGFVTINNIYTLIFNWKIAAILFVSVIDYY